MSADRRKAMIEADHPRLSIARQCALVSIARSTFYREPAPESAVNLDLMRRIRASIAAGTLAQLSARILAIPRRSPAAMA